MPLGRPARLLVLAGYYLVMILPIRIGFAVIFGDRAWPRLKRLVPRLEHEATVTLLWRLRS